VTTAPAPMNAKRPIVTPQTSVALAPSVAPRRTTVGAYACLRTISDLGFAMLVKTHEGPQKTSSSSVTPS